jgi:dipeptidyl-peptidase 4
MTDSVPRQIARTRHFTLGAPRSFSVSENAPRIVFLRSSGGEDPVNSLWTIDLGSGAERLIADGRELIADGGGKPSAQEQARRERMRELAAGIVDYSVDADLETACFALDDRLFVADLVGGSVREVPGVLGAFDPRLDPSGRNIAYVRDGALFVTDLFGDDRLLVHDDDPDVTWGLAEFIAAEEMGRNRGYWWASDGSALAVARVNVAPVARWHIADPSNPARVPTVVRYPAAGTPNADVSLHVVALEGGTREVEWDRDRWPYLAAVTWTDRGPPTLLAQSRDQTSIAVVAFDEASNQTRVAAEQHDSKWLELIPGVPDYLADGRVVLTEDSDDTRRVTFAGEAVTPAGLQVRRIVACGEGCLFEASTEPTETHVWYVSEAGKVEQLTGDAGVHGATGSEGLWVAQSRSLSRPGVVATVRSGEDVRATIESRAELPLVEPRVELMSLGARRLRAALLTPSDGNMDRLPVLLDPYGGPHFQRVTHSANGFVESQWWADQGFAVLVVDGRGTPGRGPSWEREVHLDIASIVLDDQIDALREAAALHPEMDLEHVAIRGWSFGGYLAALAILRRPDVFRAGVAGAPVADWLLYDTHYTERYLGNPAQQPEAYRRASLVESAPELRRPLLIIHGLVDDNVVVANSLRLSRALLESGRAHSFLPLSGVTHFTPEEVVTENLVLIELEWLRGALGLAPTGRARSGAGR